MATNGKRSLIAHLMAIDRADLPLSSHRLRLPLYAIKGEARMLLNAIEQKVFRFPFSVFRFLLTLQKQKPMANGQQLKAKL